MRGRLVFSVLVTGLLVASQAFAQSAASDADASASVNVASLEREIATSFDDQTKALAVEDCAVACRALASIQRATSKLCELDPGARCVSARSKLDIATERVREACPQCAVAFGPPAPVPQERAVATPASLETVHGGGGCGGCTVMSTSTCDRGVVALLALGGVLALARRRRQRHLQ